MRFLLLALLISSSAFARDDGRYASSNPELKNWFDQLSSKRGRCCSDADGHAVSDVDWESKNGHYRVRFKDQWYDVPDAAVVTEPNLVGRTMIWSVQYQNNIYIHCFMPGPMT